MNLDDVDIDSVFVGVALPLSSGLKRNSGTESETGESFRRLDRVMKQGLQLTVVGVAIRLVGTLVLTRLMRSFLFGVATCIARRRDHRASV